MTANHPIRVALRTPDWPSQVRLSRVLASDPAISITDESDPSCDITLVHADVLNITRGPPRKMRESPNIVVYHAPNDPATLARVLAAGVRGYHCIGEPLSKLREVVHQTHRGEVRSDPAILRELLKLYRGLRKEATRRGL